MDIKSSSLLFTTAGMALACFLTGLLGLQLAYGDTYSPLFWPPAGIALGAVLIWGNRVLPGVMLGHLAVGLLAGLAPATLLMICLGSLLSPALGGWMLRRWLKLDIGLPELRHLLMLVIFGGALPAVLNTLLGMSGFILAGVMSWEQIRIWHWLLWWMGDMAGVLLLTPVMLLSVSQPGWWRGARSMEAVIALVLLLLVCGISFGSWLPLQEARHLPLAFLPFPFLIWIAIRVPLIWGSLSVLLVSLAALGGTYLGFGPFVRESATESLALLWSFMATSGLMTLLLATGMSAQRRSRDMLEMIFEANPNVIVLADESGRIQRVNRRCIDLLGYRPAELQGQAIESLVPTEWVERHRHYRNNFMQQPKTRLMGSGPELNAVHKAGHRVAVEIGLAPIRLENGRGVLAAISDNRLRKQAEQALLQERNFVTGILDTTHALVLVLDPSLRLVRFNPACEKVSGLAVESAEGQSLFQLGLIPGSEQADLQSLLGRLLQGQQAGHWENHWCHTGGGQRIISWSGNPLRDETGQPRYLICTGIDITEQRQAEEKLQQWQVNMVHRDRIATANELASSLAHELNQPLTAIAGYCDVAMNLANMDCDRDSQLSEVIAKAEHQAQRAGKIIQHLRTFVSRAQDQRQEEDLNQLISETVGFVANDCEKKGAVIRLDLAEGLPQSAMVKVQIEQVLVNLLRNACEVMEQAACRQRLVRISSRLNSPRQLQVTVADSGPGVPAEIAQRLFSPFESTKPTGLGMGLAISRSIIEEHGGRLWLDSSVADGATFHFTLPVDVAGGIA